MRKLNMWVEKHARSKAVPLGGTSINTRVAEDLLSVNRLTRENGVMGLVHRASGIEERAGTCDAARSCVGRTHGFASDADS